MNKYIKLEDAIGCECPFNEIWEDCVGCPLNDSEIEPCKMGKWLKSLPTIDIVHCKECRHCLDEVIDDTIPIYIYCDLWKGETEWDSFCSYGERIANE